MAKQSINFLKSLYVTGAKPLKDAFWDWLDSFRHKDDKILFSDLDPALAAYIQGTATTEQVAALAVDVSSKLDVAAVGVAGGAASLGEDGKVPAEQLDVNVDVANSLSSDVFDNI